MSEAKAMTVRSASELGQAIEQVLVGGDLSRLSADDRVRYYRAVCESLGLNPLTKPFDYLNLNGKLTLYARRDCTEQLRRLHGVSVKILAREVVEDCYVVSAQAIDRTGRTDESLGVVPIGNLRGEARANAMMKAETKAKRRVTLSLCGLGMLDESEAEGLQAAPVEFPKSEPRVMSDAEAAKFISAAPVMTADEMAKEYAAIKAAILAAGTVGEVADTKERKDALPDARMRKELTAFGKARIQQLKERGVKPANHDLHSPDAEPPADIHGGDDVPGDFGGRAA